MINKKTMYHLDEFNISSFCPNTMKLNNRKNNKFVFFNNFLHSFHDNEAIYENQLSYYINYIVYSIYMDSLKLDKNILQYESYFFNVISGYATVKKVNISPSTIGRYWITIIENYDVLVNIFKKETIKNLDYFQDVIITMKHINVSKMNNNYYFKIPIVLNYVDSSKDVVLFLPHYGQSIYSNIVFLNTIKNIQNLSNVHVFSFNMKNFTIEYKEFKITKILKNNTIKFLNNLYIDFSKSNIFNCNICPASPCNYDIILNNIQPSPYNSQAKTNKIKLLNLEK